MAASPHPLRAFRLEQKPKLSQDDLAGRIGTTKGNVSRIEKGKQALTEKLLFACVEQLDIPARVLRPDLARLFAKSGRAKRRDRAA